MLESVANPSVSNITHTYECIDGAHISTALSAIVTDSISLRDLGRWSRLSFVESNL